jgi:hypothetical protein
MSKENKDEMKDYQNEIDDLKKEIEGLKNEAQIDTLKARIEDLKKQKANAQIADDQSLSNIPGLEEEFENLKADAVKQNKKNKRNKIVSSLTSLVSIPISGVIVYFLLQSFDIGAFLELEQNYVQYIYWAVAGIFIWVEIKHFFELIKSIFINPEVIDDQTLSYLSLTAKEHILDPKGSVIREKYGTGKWSSVTHT